MEYNNNIDILSTDESNIYYNDIITKDDMILFINRIKSIIDDIEYITKYNLHLEVSKKEY